MRVQSDFGRLPSRHVTIVDVGDESDERIIDFVLEHTGETRGRLFGTAVRRFPDTPDAVLVILFTD